MTGTSITVTTALSVYVLVICRKVDEEELLQQQTSVNVSWMYETHR